jgi:hypothetical protein
MSAIAQSCPGLSDTDRKGGGSPLTQTYPLAASAKTRRKPMNRNASRLLADTVSVEKIIVLINCP